MSHVTPKSKKHSSSSTSAAAAAAAAREQGKRKRKDDRRDLNQNQIKCSGRVAVGVVGTVEESRC